MSLIKIIKYISVIMILPMQTALSYSTAPITAWDALLQSNKKFVKNRGFAKQREMFKTEQNPPIIVLSCSDSRVPPELIFDRKLGELFVVRVAGQVVDKVVIDSIEYAVTTFDSHVIVILGHSRCGAVSGALGRLQKKVSKKATEHLDAILNPIEKAIKESGIDVHDTRALEESIQANVKYIAKQLISESDVISDALKSGQIVIVGAEYFIDTGNVDELFAMPETMATNQSSLVGPRRRRKL